MDYNSLIGIDVNEDFDFLLLDTYIYNIDLSKIEIINTIKLDKDNYQKLDAIIINEYSFRGFDFTTNLLPLILSFNNLQDIVEIKIGTLLKLPNLENLLSEIVLINFDNNVPGVNKQRKVATKNSNTKSTTAQNKLKITLPEVVYNKENGIITY